MNYLVNQEGRFFFLEECQGKEESRCLSPHLSYRASRCVIQGDRILLNDLHPYPKDDFGFFHARNLLDYGRNGWFLRDSDGQILDFLPVEKAGFALYFMGENVHCSLLTNKQMIEVFKDATNNAAGLGWGHTSAKEILETKPPNEIYDPLLLPQRKSISMC